MSLGLQVFGSSYDQCAMISKRGFASYAPYHHFPMEIDAPTRIPTGKCPPEHMNSPYLNSLFELHACFAQ